MPSCEGVENPKSGTEPLEFLLLMIKMFHIQSCVDIKMHDNTLPGLGSV